MTAKIKLNAASGGGSISIQAPSSSSNNRVIALPDIADGTLVTSQSTLDATKLSGNLPAISGAALTGISAGITMADSWRLTTNFTGDANPIASNWERSDVSPWEGYLGSAGLTESSGVFTFPLTGWYFIISSHYFTGSGDSPWNEMTMMLTNNSGSSYADMNHTEGWYERSGTAYQKQTTHIIIDITNVSTQNMKFRVDVDNNSTVTFGNTARTHTGFDIIRLGDT